MLLQSLCFPKRELSFGVEDFKAFKAKTAQVGPTQPHAEKTHPVGPTLPRGEKTQPVCVSEIAEGGQHDSLPPLAPPSPLQSEQDMMIDPCSLSMEMSIGKGVTAEVFRGTYQSKVVAIKVMVRNKLVRKEQDTFTRELAVLRQVNHPNLVRLLGATETPLRILMEFCEGGTVFDLVHNDWAVPLDWLQKTKMCADVARGMCYLHSYSPQIIHRDLKSLNLLLDRPVKSVRDVPYVKVADFGVSRMKTEITQSWGNMTQGAGTVHWMAPEMSTGTKYTEKADVYSFAMVMYEVLCREIPFEKEKPERIGNMTVGGVRPNLERVPSDCHALLRKLMIACWHGKPQERPGFGHIIGVLNSLPCCA